MVSAPFSLVAGVSLLFDLVAVGRAASTQSGFISESGVIAPQVMVCLCRKKMFIESGN